MLQLTLTRVSIQNFRSFVNDNFLLPLDSGLNFLGGENFVEQRLGANGTGKTSLWEAVVWCWYGTSIRGARTSGVLSWGAKTVDVVTEFLIDSTPHTIRRFGPPQKVELDGKVVEQQAIDNLLRLTYKRFLHSVIFGQSKTLFPDLEIPERGNLLDEVLNLNIWNKCSEVAGKKHSSLERMVSVFNADLSYANGKLATLESDEAIEKLITGWNQERDNDVVSLQKQEQEWEGKNQAVISNLNLQLQTWKDELKADYNEKVLRVEQLEAELKEFEQQFQKNEAFTKSAAEVKSEITKLESEKEATQREYITTEVEAKQVEKGLTFWKDTQVCSTCSQAISQEKRKEQLSSLEQKDPLLKQKLQELSVKFESYNDTLFTHRANLDELKRDSALEEQRYLSVARNINRINGDIKRLEQECEKMVGQRDPYSQQIEMHKGLSNPIKAQINLLLAKVNPFITQLEKVRHERQQAEIKKAQLELDITKMNEQLISAEYWKHGFKRIRLFFVKRILANLEIEISSAISALGLEGWSITLATEVETKSGTLKLGVQIHVKDPKGNEGPWETWSGGESQRLRLAMAMGLASLIQRAAGINYKLEVWDEPTAFLSDIGIEDLLQALQHRAESLNKQVWLCDHRALIFSGFHEIWTVVKEATGSHVYLTTKES